MPSYVMKKIGCALNERKITINGANILILGIAYKKNVDDMRESPSVEIMEKLRKRGAVVSYSDPHVEVFPAMRSHKFDLKSIEITSGNLKEYDCVVLTTDHDKFDYDTILKYSNLIVDTRGKFKEKSEKVIKA